MVIIPLIVDTAKTVPAILPVCCTSREAKRIMMGEVVPRQTEGGRRKINEATKDPTLMPIPDVVSRENFASVGINAIRTDPIARMENNDIFRVYRSARYPPRKYPIARAVNVTPITVDQTNSVVP